MDIYVLRFYDWDFEHGPILGLFTDYSQLLACVFDAYSGRFNPDDIPKEFGVPFSIELDNGEWGAKLNITRYKDGKFNNKFEN